MARTPITGDRGLRAPGFLVAGLVSAFLSGQAAAAIDLPKEPDALMDMIRGAIETKDYETFRELVYWEGAGEIKRRLVRFELNRGLGRPIYSIALEDFPENGLAGVEATGSLAANMQFTYRVRVVYDEPVLEKTGKRPAAVYLIGKVDETYRIGLVNRKRVDDDD
ncbi:MAG: hypothetical protein WD969_06500 [Paracoccaceae bacterium]